jgi:hypothetical protein
VTAVQTLASKFLYLLTLDDKALLKALASFKEEDFASRVHYEHYKRFVLPLIEGVGKIREYPEGCHVVRALNAADIYVSERYLLMVFYERRKVKEKKLFKLGYYDDLKGWYLLGLGDDSKIFVNVPDLDIFHYGSRLAAIEGAVLRRKSPKMRLFEINCEEIRRLFDYDEDLEVDEKGSVTIEKSGRYRVQGEIVVNAGEITFEDVKGLIKGFNWVEYVTTMLLDDIARVLIDFGFEVEIGPSSIIIEGALMNEREKDVATAFRAFSNIFTDALMLYGIADEVMEKVFYGGPFENDEEIDEQSTERFGCRINLRGKRYGTFTTHIRAGPEMDGFSSIEIRPYPSKLDGEIYSSERREAEEHLKALLERRIDVKRQIGNHVITMKNIAPMFVRYRPRQQPLIYEMVVMESGVRGSFYADERSELIIESEEHGTTLVRFRKPFRVTIGTTRVSQDQRIERNSIVFDLLTSHQTP